MGSFLNTEIGLPSPIATGIYRPPEHFATSFGKGFGHFWDWYGIGKGLRQDMATLFWDTEKKLEGKGVSTSTLDRLRSRGPLEITDDYWDVMAQVKKENPELLANIPITEQELKNQQLRKYNASYQAMMGANGTLPPTDPHWFGNVLGSLFGMMSDPIILLSMAFPIGGGAIKTASSVGQAAWKVGRFETILGLGTEGIIQLKTQHYLHKIGVDGAGFSRGLANTLAVGLGAGVIGAGIGAGVKAVINRRLTAAKTPPEGKVKADDVPREKPEAKTPPEVGERLSKEVLEGHYITIRASKVGFLPESFQFKSLGSKKTGDTGRLASVKDFNPRDAGLLLFYEYKNGDIVVVNGHQRLNLAKRIGERDSRDIEVRGYVLREVDGVTPNLAATEGILQNLLEAEKLTSIILMDAARAMRNNPERYTRIMDAMPKGPEDQRTLLALHNLTDLEFGYVANDVMSPQHARMIYDTIGQQAGDVGVARREQIFEFLAGENLPELTDVKALSLIRRVVMTAPSGKTEGGLFANMGEGLLFKEMVEVEKTARNIVNRTRKTFSNLSKHDDLIVKRAANKLDKKGNIGEADINAAILTFIDDFSHVKGSVASRLAEITQKAYQGGKFEKNKIQGASDFIDYLREGLTAGRLQAEYGELKKMAKFVSRGEDGNYPDGSHQTPSSQRNVPRGRSPDATGRVPGSGQQGADKGSPGVKRLQGNKDPNIRELANEGEKNLNDWRGARACVNEMGKGSSSSPNVPNKTPEIPASGVSPVTRGKTPKARKKATSKGQASSSGTYRLINEETLKAEKRLRKKALSTTPARMKAPDGNLKPGVQITHIEKRPGKPDKKWMITREGFTLIETSKK